MSKELNKNIGKLEAQVAILQKTTTDLATEVHNLSAQMNRWKGGGMVLLVIGTSLGFIVDTLFKICLLYTSPSPRDS
mgnify:CR=1 FL=1